MICLLARVIFILAFLSIQMNAYANNPVKVKLNPPRFKQNLKVLLEKRCSYRSFQDKALNLDDVSAILWASCGKKSDSLSEATRTVPSAGATNPLEVYLVVGRKGVDKLKEGVYHYSIEEHALELAKDGDLRAELAGACLNQGFIKQAPVSIVVAAKFIRTTRHYGERGIQYVYIEVGHACQNTYLAVGDLGLATVEVGAFYDDSVKDILDLEKDLTPISIMPIGYAKEWAK